MTLANLPSDADRLVRLLPAMYGTVDATSSDEPGFLRTLLGLVAEQLHEIEDDVDSLYDDLFIETCQPWVVPYIGELVGVHPGPDVTTPGFTTRSQVANVIALRRRKGTADVVEELTVAITGWPARAVEMYSSLAASQHLNHLRSQTITVSLRSARSLELIDTAADPFMHRTDARWIRSGRGRHHPGNLAVFVWPQVDLLLVRVDAAPVDPARHRFHPLGIDTTLLTNRTGGSVIGLAATTSEVPWPISRRLLDHDLRHDEALYGATASFFIETAEGPVAAGDIVTCCLADDGGGGWQNVGDVQADQVGVDPELGRMVLGSARSAPVTVSFVQALTGPIGGGYARGLEIDGNDPATRTVGASGADHATLDAAFAPALAAAAASEHRTATVALIDSRTYPESPSLPIDAGTTLAVVAGDGVRPTIDATDGLRFDCGDGASIELDGLLVGGGPVVVTGRPARIVLRNCTLVPGQHLGADLSPRRPDAPSLLVDTAAGEPEVVIERSVTGGVLAPATATVRIADSIVQGGRQQGEAPVTRMVSTSGDLSTLPALGASPNEITVLVTDHLPIVVDVGSPATADDAAATIDSIGPDPELQAVVHDNRVVVTAEADLSIRNRSLVDATADQLGFTRPGSRNAAFGARRSGPLFFDTPTPSFELRTGSGPSRTLTLPSAPAALDQSAPVVQDAIRSLGPAPEFAEALVFTIDDRLVLVPGVEDVHWSFATSATDATASGVLGIAAALPAIASDGHGATGPTIRLERVTVLGTMRATSVELVSDSVLAQPLLADRGQAGCVRFSYVAPGSVTPRRYRCVPNHECTPHLAIHSTRYGDPRFGELVPTESMAVVRHGSSTGDQMGAFCAFKHRLREQTLMSDLDEFMRLSMEAGVLDGRPNPRG